MKIMVAYNELGMQETVFLVDDDKKSQWHRGQFASKIAKIEIEGKKTALLIASEQNANNFTLLDKLRQASYNGLGGVTSISIAGGHITNTRGATFLNAENLIEGQEIDVEVYTKPKDSSKVFHFYTNETKNYAVDLYYFYPHKVQQKWEDITYSDWWELSQESIEDMKVAAENGRLWNAMYCGQQAVEKALKSLCVKSGARKKYVVGRNGHDLLKLAEKANLISLTTWEMIDGLIEKSGCDLSNSTDEEWARVQAETVRNDSDMWKFSKVQVEWLEALTLWNTEARYPERRLGLKEICTQQFVEAWFSRVNTLCKLIKNNIDSELSTEE